jgi:hypothetical protein
MHWLELLTHYNYKIHYHPGDKNSATDALSRCTELRPPDGEDKKPMSLIPLENFTELAACETDLTTEDWTGLLEVIITTLKCSDSEIQAEARKLTAEWPDKPQGLEWEDGLGRKDGRIWVPESDDLWRKVLGLYHDSLITGHLGTSRTMELISWSYWRRDLQNWVKHYVEGCHMCQRAKHWNQCEFRKMQPIPVPNGLWQWVQSDFIGELPKSSSFNVIYVISDRLMKMAHFILTTTDVSALDLMRLHIQHIWNPTDSQNGSRVDLHHCFHEEPVQGTQDRASVLHHIPSADPRAG